MLLGELRAEVANWWQKLVRQQKQQEVTSSGDARSDSGSTSKTSETHIRLITHGSELTTDMDKKSLQSLQFKDNQVMV